MVAMYQQQLAKLVKKIEPIFELIYAKWKQLQAREQKLVAGLGIFLVATLIFMLFTTLLDFKKMLEVQVNSLAQFEIYSQQAAKTSKALAKVEVNSFNQVVLEQIKADVAQVLQIKEPDILIQDGQMTLNIANAQFIQVMILLEQFRRSYALFPSQLTITRLSRAGFVSFSATFWVKQ